MRTFKVLLSMNISANSFADAEKKVHRIMAAGFNESDGNYPSYFETLNIDKGEKL